MYWMVFIVKLVQRCQLCIHRDSNNDMYSSDREDRRGGYRGRGRGRARGMGRRYSDRYAGNHPSYAVISIFQNHREKNKLVMSKTL